MPQVSAPLAGTPARSSAPVRISPERTHDVAEGRAVPPLRFDAGNRLLSVAGTSLLVSPIHGSWLRLSVRGAELLRALGGPDGTRRDAGGGLEGFTAAEARAFADALVREGFARDEGAAPGRPTALPARGVPADPAAPVANVVLNVTRRCNLRCEHCAVYAACGEQDPAARAHVTLASRRAGDLRPSPPPADETTEALVRLIERLAAHGTKTLVLFGGEPLLRADIREVISFAAERVPNLCLFTNGTLLSEPLCRLIAERVHEVRVSLDGSRPDVHDRIRGRGTFQRVVKGIQRLVSMGHRRVVAKTVITRRNVHDVPNMVKLAKKLGVALDLGTFVPLGMGDIHRHELLVDPGDLLEAYQRVWLLAEYYELPSASFNVFCKPFMARAATSCGTSCGYVLVDCSGDVFPCEGLQYWPLRLGNLLTGEPRDLRPLLETFDPSVDRLPRCADCELRYFCKGGCAAEAYVSGSGGGRDSALCRFYRAVLPAIVRHYEPRVSSWQNLQRVFGGALELSAAKEPLLTATAV